MRKPAEVVLNVPGVHNAQNALAASAVGLALHVPRGGHRRGAAELPRLEQTDGSDPDRRRDSAE